MDHEDDARVVHKPVVGIAAIHDHSSPLRVTYSCPNCEALPFNGPLNRLLRR